jgi:hypothetical protein
MSSQTYVETLGFVPKKDGSVWEASEDEYDGIKHEHYIFNSRKNAKKYLQEVMKRYCKLKTNYRFKKMRKNEDSEVWFAQYFSNGEWMDARDVYFGIYRRTVWKEK